MIYWEGAPQKKVYLKCSPFADRVAEKKTNREGIYLQSYVIHGGGGTESIRRLDDNNDGKEGGDDDHTILLLLIMLTLNHDDDHLDCP